jgi:dipeptidyl aminopeptidase/acylaminoacyl peptidase
MENRPIMQIRWKRVICLTLFATALVLVALNFSLAWVYVHALIWPGCVEKPRPIPGAPMAEEIVLLTEGGLQLRAWYYPSANNAAILSLGGSRGALGDHLPLAGPLIDAGYGVLQIDSRACTNPSAPVTLGYHEAADAAAGFIFLSDRQEVDPFRIGIIGFSMGGVAAIRTAARNPEIAAVIAEGGYYNLGGDIVEAGRYQPIHRRFFLYSIAGIFWLQTGINPWASSPIDDLPEVSPRPVLLIYGEGEIEEARAAEQFAAAREPKELWVVPGGAHGGNHLAAPLDYPRRVVEFFNQNLLSSAN